MYKARKDRSSEANPCLSEPVVVGTGIYLPNELQSGAFFRWILVEHPPGKTVYPSLTTQSGAFCATRVVPRVKSLVPYFLRDGIFLFFQRSIWIKENR